MKKIKFWVFIYHWLLLYYVSLLFMERFTLVDTHNSVVQFIAQIVCMIIVVLYRNQEENGT